MLHKADAALCEGLDCEAGFKSPWCSHLRCLCWVVGGGRPVSPGQTVYGTEREGKTHTSCSLGAEYQLSSAGTGTGIKLKQFLPGDEN